MKPLTFEKRVEESLTRLNKRITKLEGQAAKLNQPMMKTKPAKKVNHSHSDYLEDGIFNHDDFTNG